MTSLALHTINQRDAHRSNRFHLATKTTILEELLGRIWSGDPSLTLYEVNKAMKLAETHTLVVQSPDKEKAQETTSWRDTIFGKKRDLARTNRNSEMLRNCGNKTPGKQVPAPEQQTPSPIPDPTVSSPPPHYSEVLAQTPKKSGKVVFY
ncbi:hypothetical protein FRC04_007634 [Tulasnella sp. 424]|nr:hypothetical protein FRC04_007634 [Tulasnella sp. 424]KAG8979067.1 hypothetical protein FRC05_009277 [Tulasnella sp. 425]